MPSPINMTSRDAIIRPDLQKVIQEIDLAGNADGMIGLKIAPPIMVQSPAMRIKKVKLQELLKNRATDTRRAPGSTYNRITAKFDTDFYICEEHGLEEALDDAEVKMYGEENAEQNAALRVWHSVRQGINDDVVGQVLALPSTQKTAAPTLWSNQGSATPLFDVQKARKAFKNRIGIMPNKLALGWEAYENLKYCDQILGVFNKWNELASPEKVNLKMLAVAFDVDEVIIDSAMVNTAGEDQAGVLASSWDSANALLFYNSPSKDIQAPRFAANMVWTGDTSNAAVQAETTPEGFVVETYYSTSRRSKVVRTRIQNDVKLWRPELAQLLTGLN